MLHNQAKEITELKSAINALTTEISNLDLKDALTKLREAVNSLKSPTLEMSIPSSVPILSSSKPHTSAQKPVLNSLKDSADTLHDRRYCVVVYGIPENPTGMQQIECLKADLTNTMSIMTQVSGEISSTAISNCYRLGKYNQNSNRPRPILVKFGRTVEVAMLLNNRKNIPKGISIKPYMTPGEREVESLLLKCRWKLINEGTNRKDIRLRNSCIYVSGKLHGKVTGNTYSTIDPSDTNTNSINTTTSDTTSMDTHSDSR